MVPHREHGGLRLWTDADGSRFFLIAGEASLPPGPCLIKTATGKRQQVDPDTLTPFEVTRNQAEEWLRGQLDTVTQGLKTAVSNVVQQWKAAAAHSRDQVETLLDAAREASKDPATAARHAAALEQLAASIEQRSARAAVHLRAAAEDLCRRAREQV